MYAAALCSRRSCLASNQRTSMRMGTMLPNWMFSCRNSTSMCTCSMGSWGCGVTRCKVISHSSISGKSCLAWRRTEGLDRSLVHPYLVPRGSMAKPYRAKFTCASSVPILSLKSCSHKCQGKRRFVPPWWGGSWRCVGAWSIPCSSLALSCARVLYHLVAVNDACHSHEAWFLLLPY